MVAASRRGTTILVIGALLLIMGVGAVEAATDHSYTCVWPGDLGVGRLTLRFREPVAASNISVQPDLIIAPGLPDPTGCSTGRRCCG
jgi:hypothetical protein